MKTVGLAAIVSLALLTSAAAGAATLESFRMPSRNVGCLYSTAPAGLRCDILSGLKPEPHRKCELDWTGFYLSPNGRTTPNCAGDTVYDRRAPILGYGRTWHRGAFTCVSKTTGLRCRNRAGHGFVLARGHSYSF